MKVTPESLNTHADWFEEGGRPTAANFLRREADQLKSETEDEAYLRELAKVHHEAVYASKWEAMHQETQDRILDQIRAVLDRLKADGRLTDPSDEQKRKRRQLDALAQDERAKERIKLANATVMAARERLYRDNDTTLLICTPVKADSWTGWEAVPEGVTVADCRGNKWAKVDGNPYIHLTLPRTGLVPSSLSDDGMNDFAPFMRVDEDQK